MEKLCQVPYPTEEEISAKEVCTTRTKMPVEAWRMRIETGNRHYWPMKRRGDCRYLRLLLERVQIEGKKLGHDWVVISLDYKRKRKPKGQEGENNEKTKQTSSGLGRIRTYDQTVMSRPLCHWATSPWSGRKDSDPRQPAWKTPRVNGGNSLPPFWIPFYLNSTMSVKLS